MKFYNVDFSERMTIEADDFSHAKAIARERYGEEKFTMSHSRYYSVSSLNYTKKGMVKK